ncbi:Arrestin (or S antigen) N terminal domain [Trypanosoma vivax]|uniref:Arrestin-like N-terminal domain-containing protein n=1 Tax=Trypanosoma vivax (strain Y486) TaxID=1055687 RepID=G0UCU0_TRYVY|nr:hypothetical protein TRVL_02340 [Trypanosoma vivax]KAH8607976.1 Arrestin (or S antigen) N terminal domain [Trypanosoma vivax]CCC53650.1 conserved hypothetical protein [Trypanosoma vivax Y486]
MTSRIKCKHIEAFRVLLEYLTLHPGEILRGVVEVVLTAPVGFSTLQATVYGAEESRVFYSIAKRFEKDTLRTVYCDKRVLLAGYPIGMEVIHVTNASVASDDSSGGDWSDTEAVTTITAAETCGLRTSGLMPGTYTFPFEAQLPPVLPPSYSDRHGSAASKISYSVQVKMYLGHRVLAVAEAPFMVRMVPVDEALWIKAHSEADSVIRRGCIVRKCAVSGEGNVPSTMDSVPQRGLRKLVVDHSLLIHHFAKKVDASASSAGACGAGATEESEKCLTERRSCNWMVGSEQSGSAMDDGKDDANSVKRKGREGSVKEGTGVACQYKGNPGTVREAPSPSPKKEGMSSSSGTLPVTTQWEQYLSLPNKWPLSKGTTNVCLTLHNLIYSPGTSARFSAVIDNTKGASAIKSIKFSIVVYIEINSCSEVSEYKRTLRECVVKEHIGRGDIRGIPAMELQLPGDTPFTLVTGGYTRLIFLKIKVRGERGLKSLSGSARTELVIVDSLVSSKDSVQCCDWTNYYLGIVRPSDSTPECIVAPYVVNGAVKIVYDGQESSCTKPLGRISTRARKNSLPGTIARPQLDFENVIYYPLRVSEAAGPQNPLISTSRNKMEEDVDGNVCELL